MATSISSHLFKNRQNKQNTSRFLANYSRLCQLIPFLPVEYRKVIVTACRLRLPYDLPHPDLDKAFYDLDAFYHDGAIIDIDTFKRHVRRFSSKPIRSSLLLSLALCEQMQDTKTCEEVIRTSCLKEFDAATLPTCGQQLNYSSLLDNMSGKLSILSVGHPIVTNRFIGFLQRFKSEVSSDRFPPMND